MASPEPNGVAIASSSSTKAVNMRDLESRGMTSVYLDGKFFWQLPKALLEDRVPSATLKNHSDDGDELTTDIPSVWEITDCSRDAFRVFNDWLYSPNSRLKTQSPEIPIKTYFEAVKFASRYGIPLFLQSVVGIILEALKDPQNDISGLNLGETMGSESSGRAIISGNLAVMLQHGMLDPATFKMIIKTPEMARDVLVWVELFRQCNIADFDQATKLKWATENLSEWVKIQE
ncbi:hypothetical protein PISL3812_09138 [Talaromyces islandicus]|uniref:BTB domain-containing protein n=1 Tax=Talaromyces islandicus TaxID=28573 RepID=A0A0U1M8W0_TALIS|nr:hypothetical protein PISL3812_09138 [Talaromyces islandicus]